MEYIPHQGDIVLVNFSPTEGHEQSGKRPALVVSNNSYHRYVGAVIVCPITHTMRPFPLHILLDDRTTTTGIVLCEHIRSIDYKARKAKYLETIPHDLLEEILSIVYKMI